MKKVLLIAAVLVGVVGMGAMPASAAQPKSVGCALWPQSVTYLDQPGVFTRDVSYFAGETISIEAIEAAGASEPSTTTSLALVTATGAEVVATGTFPGTLSYTIPTDGPYTFQHLLDGRGATWTVSCTAAPDVAVDTDGDGVLDADDVCADTVLPDVPTVGLTGARFAAQADGTFDSGKNSLDGLYTLEDTAGCSGTQIIALQGLGVGHTKYGISKSALEAFIATL